MPIYEFVCPTHGRFEIIRNLSEQEKLGNFGSFCISIIDDQFMEFCNDICERIPSVPAKMELGKPTNIFRNNKGEVRIPTSHNEQPPAGFYKDELRSSIERSKFEKEMQAKEDHNTEMVTIRNQMIKDETLKNRQSDTLARMETIVKDTENPTATKELLKAAMNRSKKKRPLPQKKTQFSFDVNNLNSSNLIK